MDSNLFWEYLIVIAAIAIAYIIYRTRKANYEVCSISIWKLMKKTQYSVLGFIELHPTDYILSPKLYVILNTSNGKYLLVDHNGPLPEYFELRENNIVSSSPLTANES